MTGICMDVPFLRRQPWMKPEAECWRYSVVLIRLAPCLENPLPIVHWSPSYKGSTHMTGDEPHGEIYSISINHGCLRDSDRFSHLCSRSWKRVTSFRASSHYRYARWRTWHCIGFTRLGEWPSMTTMHWTANRRQQGRSPYTLFMTYEEQAVRMIRLTTWFLCSKN